MKINNIEIRDWDTITVDEYERIFSKLDTATAEDDTDNIVLQICKELTTTDPRSWTKTEYDAVVEVIKLYIERWNNLEPVDYYEDYNLPEKGEFIVGQILDAMAVQNQENNITKLSTLLAIAMCDRRTYSTEQVMRLREEFGSTPAYLLLPVLNFFFQLPKNLLRSTQAYSTVNALKDQVASIGEDLLKDGNTTASWWIWHPITFYKLKTLQRRLRRMLLPITHISVKETGRRTQNQNTNKN